MPIASIVTWHHDCMFNWDHRTRYSLSPMQLFRISPEIRIEWPVRIDLSIVDYDRQLAVVFEPAGDSERAYSECASGSTNQRWRAEKSTHSPAIISDSTEQAWTRRCCDLCRIVQRFESVRYYAISAYSQFRAITCMPSLLSHDL